MQHRDLKPQNLLLDGKDCLKIADLGLACACQTAQSLDKKGTEIYMSPEKVSGQKYGTMDDMWAAGCILLELLLGEGISQSCLPEDIPRCPTGLGVMVAAEIRCWDRVGQRGMSSAGIGSDVSDLIDVLKDRDCFPRCFPAAEKIVVRLLQVLRVARRIAWWC